MLNIRHLLIFAQIYIQKKFSAYQHLLHDWLWLKELKTFSFSNFVTDIYTVF